LLDGWQALALTQGDHSLAGCATQRRPHRPAGRIADELNNLIDDPVYARHVRRHQELMLEKLTNSEKVF